MKKFFAIILIIGILFSLCACTRTVYVTETVAMAETETEANKSLSVPTTTESPATEPVETDPTVVGEIVSNVEFETQLDEDGKPILLIMFDWTNTTDEATAALWDVNIDVFENGIEADSAYLPWNHAYNDMEDDSCTEVKPGYSLRVCDCYELTGNPADVEVEIWRYNSNFNKVVLYTTTLSVNK